MGLYIHIYIYTKLSCEGGEGGGKSSLERNETERTILVGPLFYTLLQRRQWSKPIRRRDVGLSICLGFSRRQNARR